MRQKMSSKNILTNVLYKLRYSLTILPILLNTQAFASYDAFPANEGPYVSGPASAQLPWAGENFENNDLGILECSYASNAISHFDVTSGCLSTIEQTTTAGKLLRGWVDSSVFRAIAIGRDSAGREIKWTEQSAQYNAYIDSWHNAGDIPNWSGLHVFARYRTSDDLYVASLRYDGKITIKRKWKGVYTTLAQGKLSNKTKTYLDQNGKLKTGQWYLLNFSVVGKELKFYVDGDLVLQTKTGTFSWGTTGVRFDNADVFIDDWKLKY